MYHTLLVYTMITMMEYTKIKCITQIEYMENWLSYMCNTNTKEILYDFGSGFPFISTCFVAFSPRFYYFQFHHFRLWTTHITLRLKVNCELLCTIVLKFMVYYRKYAIFWYTQTGNIEFIFLHIRFRLISLYLIFAILLGSIRPPGKIKSMKFTYK